MSFRLEDFDLILGNAGILTAEQYQQTATAGGAAPVATAMVTTAPLLVGSALVPVAPAAAAANAVPLVLPAVGTNLPIQTRFLGTANVLTADIILAPVFVQPPGVTFTPIARASTQPPAAITDDAIAQRFCRLWSLQFTARDTRRRSQQAGMVYDHNKNGMNALAATTYGVLFQSMGPPSRIRGWPQMTDLVTNAGYEILRILYDHRHVLAPGEFRAHVAALELDRNRNCPKNKHGVLVQAMFTAAGYPP
ncbi:hypothetical protein DV737_g3156, partial [Chaetothyriales sp. CBS 132003]